MPFTATIAPSRSSAAAPPIAIEPCRSSWPVFPQHVRRPARRARDGLRVKAPVGRIVVLRRALRAHRPRRHRRRGPVVRQRQHDAVARAAVRAVDVRIPVAPVRRIEQLAQARIAHGHVGRDPRREPVGRRIARADLEVAEAFALRRSSCGPMRPSPPPAPRRRPRARTRRAHRARPPRAPPRRSAPLSTQPASAWRRASRYTKGRKPTPCTTPRIRRSSAPAAGIRSSRRLARRRSTIARCSRLAANGRPRRAPAPPRRRRSRRAPSSAAARRRRSSTSYSTKSRPRNSKSSRSSAVYGHVAVPYSSSISGVQR